MFCLIVMCPRPTTVTESINYDEGGWVDMSCDPPCPEEDVPQRFVVIKRPDPIPDLVCPIYGDGSYSPDDPACFDRPDDW